MAGRRVKTRVTMQDVADRAGVSQPTVSLVLGKRSGTRVAEGTRARVLRAAEELGYRPNLVARGLVRRRSYALGVIVPDLCDSFFVAILGGVQEVASEAGYAVLLCETRHAPVERHLEQLRGRLIDGVILDGLSARGLPDAALTDLNLVLVDEESVRWPSVASDAPEAGRLAARHLLELGHRRLAFLGPGYDTFSFRFRERGFVRAAGKAGVSLPSTWLRRVSPTVAGGQSGMRGLLSEPERPTAVYCANDSIALGALKACRAEGTDVPGEVALVGCEDVALARVATPELTTVSVPAAELGTRAARFLIRRLDGEEEVDEGPTPGGRRLGVRLVVRGSTAPPTPHPGDRPDRSARPRRRRAGPVRVRGSVVVTTLDYLREQGGQALVARVLGRLSPDRRRDVQAIRPGDDLPWSVAIDLWRAADLVLGKRSPAWTEQAGAFAAERERASFVESVGLEPQGSLFAGRSPQEFVDRLASLFRRDFRGGDVASVFDEPGHLVLRLLELDADPLFCARQTGVLRGALEIAVGEQAGVEHARCAADGDAFCEWELRWATPSR